MNKGLAILLVLVSFSFFGALVLSGFLKISGVLLVLIAIGITIALIYWKKGSKAYTLKSSSSLPTFNYSVKMDKVHSDALNYVRKRTGEKIGIPLYENNAGNHFFLNRREGKSIFFKEFIELKNNNLRLYVKDLKTGQEGLLKNKKIEMLEDDKFFMFIVRMFALTVGEIPSIYTEKTVEKTVANFEKTMRGENLNSKN